MEQKIKREAKIFLLLAILVIGLGYTFISQGGLLGAVVGIEQAEVGQEVLEEFKEGKEEVSVIIILEDDGETTSINTEEKKNAIKEKQEEVLDDLNLEDRKTIFGSVDEQDFELKHKYTSLNALAGEVTLEGLEKLKRDPGVEKIIINGVKHIFLSDSVPLINADHVWDLSVNGYNITGEGETVCVIDTGVDYNHSALGGGWGNKVVYGFDFHNNDTDPMDDHGHGTHVSGIVASTHGTYKGVAPDAKLAVMKVCSGSGWCTDADVLAGIERCIDESANYNISVISISLGGEQYPSYCDSDIDEQYASLINRAVGENIPVVVATGNTYGSYTNPVAGISAPACVRNATRITATDKADNMASYAFRHSSFENIITAPGSGIKSLYKGGATATSSGTSMSTPHMAGVIALFKQYWRLVYNQTPTKEQIENKIILTGKLIDDTANSGTSYSRVNILAALQPFITFISPTLEDDSIIERTYFTVNVTSDTDLTSALLELTLSNGSKVNYTMDSVTNESVTDFFYNLADMDLGAYSYRVFGSDVVNTFGISEERTLTITNMPPTLTINDPADGSKFDTGMLNFNVTVVDEMGGVDDVFLIINNTVSNESDLITVFLENINNTDFWITDINLSELNEGIRVATIFANDSFGDLTDETASFTIDRTSPVVNPEAPVDGFNEENVSSITFTYNVTDELLEISSCSLYLNDVLNETDNEITESTTQEFTKSLVNGAHNWSIQCSDEVNNVGESSVFFLNVSVIIIVDEESPVVSLIEPENNYLSANTEVQFSCSAVDDYSLANITLFGDWDGGWNADQTTLIIDSSNETVSFTKTVSDGSYTWNCLAVDSSSNSAFALANYTFSIDTTAPEITELNASEIDENSATITWTTNEVANSSVNYGNSTDFGTVVSSTSNVVSHDIDLDDLIESTTYHYEVTSCDSLGNCAVSSSNTFDTTVPSTDDDNDDDDSDDSSETTSSDDSSAGGGGGSGGDSTPQTPAAQESSGATPVENPNSEPATLELAGASEPQPLIFSQMLSLSEEEPTSINVSMPELAVTGFEIEVKVNKEINLEVKPLQNKPEELTELEGIYAYLEMNAELSEEEIDEIKVRFVVPKDWLASFNYSEKEVVLQTFEEVKIDEEESEEGNEEKGEWKELKTKLISESETEFTFESEIEHFSYFAITSGERVGFGSAITGLFGALIPSEGSTKGIVVGGMILVVLISLVAYLVVVRKVRFRFKFGE